MRDKLNTFFSDFYLKVLAEEDILLPNEAFSDILSY